MEVKIIKVTPQKDKIVKRAFVDVVINMGNFSLKVKGCYIYVTAEGNYAAKLPMVGSLTKEPYSPLCWQSKEQSTVFKHHLCEALKATYPRERWHEGTWSENMIKGLNTPLEKKPEAEVQQQYMMMRTDMIKQAVKNQEEILKNQEKILKINEAKKAKPETAKNSGYIPPKMHYHKPVGLNTPLTKVNPKLGG